MKKQSNNAGLPAGAVRPLVAVVADRTERHGHQAHTVMHGYVHAVAQAAGALPLVLPADAQIVDIESLLAHVDGVLLTGSPSNVSPHRYGGQMKPDDPSLDLDRDATVLPLVHRLIGAGVPVLGICRGFQELNVAFGGTLNSAVHALPGALDHREGDHARPIPQWYEDSHGVDIAPDGVMAGLTAQRRAMVNSLHHQGIDKLGSGLDVEAVAPDGLVEAFSVRGAGAFALAVQWHPEMRVHDDELSRRIFAAFGDACRRRCLARLRPGAQPGPQQ